FTLKNTGRAAGAEVPRRLYLTFPQGYRQLPQALRGFASVKFNRGQGREVAIVLQKKDVSVWDVVSQQWVVAKGTFGVKVGASSRDVKLTGSFQL
ncbi:fibronectin type III-like domain-containing protein, partial [Mycena crocata]